MFALLCFLLFNVLDVLLDVGTYLFTFLMLLVDNPDLDMDLHAFCCSPLL